MSAMNPALVRSYRYCEEVARREAGNFYPAFLLLPAPQRRGMCALYTFMRIADDLSDEPMPTAVKRQQLADWRGGLHSALTGRYTHPSHAALHDAVAKYHIPPRYLEAVIDGVEMDLEPTVYRTFAELRNYCWHVASVVGLSCIHIWGYRGDSALSFAEDAGIAFQLTNILRDLGEDAARGRVYLPEEDLTRFSYTRARLEQGVCDASFHALMRFEVQRARAFYQSGWRLLPRLSPSGQAVFLMMARTYRGLLREIRSRDYDVFRSRVRVPRWKKLLFALAALPVRFELM
jgi:15-cis-phytoene synthase